VKIIVYTHSMEIGGSQLNAIEIGEAVQALGHEVLLVAEDGALAITAERLGLEQVRVSNHRSRPSPRVMSLLCKLVRDRRIDVVHGYEWPPVIDGWLGPHRRFGTPVVATVMSAAVAPFIAKSIPLVVGTETLAQRCRASGYRRVDLIEPPVNIHANSPDFDAADFRQKYGLPSDTLLICVVCRLARELKLEGLLAACRVVADLVAEGSNVRLAIAGDGPVRAEVEAEAGRANARAGTNAVVLTGSLDDPRPAYASADIMLGMGGSALRALSFGKPLIVQGEAGFWRLCDEGSVGFFLQHGWYGVAEGPPGDAALRAALLPLLGSAQTRRRLGAFGRKLIVDRFSLEAAARVQLDIYQQAIDAKVRATPAEIYRCVWDLGRHKVSRKWARLWGTVAADDFNALAEQKKAEARDKLPPAVST
jgi:glycosyltransferase involved in cell wall biosynthesis